MNPGDLKLTRCVLCGSMVALGRGPVYAVAEDAVLCFPCAVQRGGTYDDAARSWVSLPCCSGLPLSEAGGRAARADRPYFAQRSKYAAG